MSAYQTQMDIAQLAIYLLENTIGLRQKLQMDILYQENPTLLRS